jgi:hydrogenase/urease accessory protein HupE
MTRMLKRLVLVAMLLAPQGARPHEIGTTTVRLTLHSDHRWTAIITTAPQKLANQLELEAGQSQSAGLAAEALRIKLEGFRRALAHHIEVRFDGRISPAAVSIAEIEVAPDAIRPDFVLVSATGSIPRNVKTVSWRYDLVLATYALLIADGDDAKPQTHWLQGDIASRAFPIISGVTSPSNLQIAVQYLRLGFLHIVPDGLDHILFVLGIFLLTTRLRDVLIQITAFTVAHSVTLCLTMYGVVSLPSRIVEPLIALSVAYVGVENIISSKATPWRPAVVFGFGLLHGMGFAGVLTELRLPRTEIIPALVSFNIGIELAQLAIIAGSYFTFAIWFRDKWWYRPRIVIPASAAIAATGLLLTVQRLAAP